MSKTLQDQFIDDDEEDCCPLCVEEFDLSDKGFRPCPCQYQVCQFCYHNLRNNGNGLCPACRRPYDDQTIEFRKPSAEDEAAWRAKQAARQKKNTTLQQKEDQKREADSASRKHLAGLRVVQKNLVYVTGLSPSVQEDRLLETLRGQNYFGQYGKIIKIVVSKAKDNQSSVGVYVTYARKEDAASCIKAVDGSVNGDRTLRAQYGTTKYCSAYLRNEQCQNRNCMFLHEPGEDKDSFTRQDLSSMNASNQQQQSSFSPPHAPPQSQQPVAAAARPESTAPLATTAEPGPALPSSASWASKPQPPSRSVSRAAASASPALTTATSVSQPSQNPTESAVPSASLPSATPALEMIAPSQDSAVAPAVPLPQPPVSANAFIDHVDTIISRKPTEYHIDLSTFIEEEQNTIRNIPSFFDPEGGRKRRLRLNLLEEDRQRQAQESERREEGDDILQRSGSLQLGGEPETDNLAGQPNMSQQGFDSAFPLDRNMGDLNLNNRGIAPSTQHALSQHFSSSPSEAPGFLVHQQQSGASAGQMGQPGHARNQSRFSFANDTSATTSVKPVANSKLMNQQNAMMPSQAGNAFGQQSGFYTGTVGPPPGLKTTGTPPVSGGGMFAQGHNFGAAGLGYGNNTTSRNSNDEMMNSLYNRKREVQDAGKQADHVLAMDPAQQSAIQSNMVTGLPESAFPELPSVQRRSTPSVPPGLLGLGQSHAPLPVTKPALPKKALESKLPPPGQANTSISQVTPVTSRGDPAATFTASASAPLTAKENLRTDDSKIEAPKVIQTADGSSMLADSSVKAGMLELENKHKSSSVTESTAKIKTFIPQTPVKTTVSNNASPLSVKDAKSEGPAKEVPRSEQPKPPPRQPSFAAQLKAGIPSNPSDVNKESGQAMRKNHPGKIDIAAAAAQKLDGFTTTPKSIRSETPSKLRGASTPSVQSRPESPASVSDIAVRRNPRTLRLVDTPKAEYHPVAPLSAAASKLPSRNPSIASAQIPGTPSSEHISDSMSLPSTSISRPASPPVSGIVGSASVRVSKNQKKKQRQERKTADEDTKVGQEPEQTEETIHEAITSRKKKSKKPTSAPRSRSKPEVPSPAEPMVQEAGTSHEQPVQAEKPESNDSRKPSLEVSQSDQAATPASPAETLPDIQPNRLMSDMRSSSAFLSSVIDSFFRPFNQQAAAYKATQPITTADLDPDRPIRRNPDVNLPPGQLADVLRDSCPLQYGGEDGRVWSHGCITPGGAHLRHLEPSLEERYLELEKDLRTIPERLRFRPRTMSRQVMEALPTFDLEAMRADMEVGGARARDANAMEKAVEEGSKKGSFLVGAADGYIDEFVMPVVSSTAAVVDGARPPDAEVETGNPTLAEIERMLGEVRREAEDAEKELRKAIKRNRKVVGYAH